MALIGVCALLPYLPFLVIPLFSDDYIQIALGRQYGPAESWGNLANDVLYRCRATSIVITYWMERWAGDGAVAHRAVNIGLHILGAMLVALLGSWRRIGYRISIPAAAFFGLREAHQEAVIWVAALPELLCFVFVMGAVLGWIRYLETRRVQWCAVSVAAFLLGLASKESAAVFPGLALLLWWVEARRWRTPLVWIGAMGVLVAGYGFSIFMAKASHLHLNDGTFTVQLGFVWTMVHSLMRLMWPWGAAALAVLGWGGWQIFRGQVAGAMAWMVVTLLPYSFLTYMDRVPSRHTYLASVGIAVLMGCAWVQLERMGKPGLVRLAMALVLIHNLGYLWTKKYDQYQRRVEPTERFLQYAASSRGPIRITCAPYGFEVFRQAAVIRLGWSPEQVLGAHETSPAGEPADYCDTSKP